MGELTADRRFEIFHRQQSREREAGTNQRRVWHGTPQILKKVVVGTVQQCSGGISAINVPKARSSKLFVLLIRT